MVFVFVDWVDVEIDIGVFVFVVEYVMGVVVGVVFVLVYDVFELDVVGFVVLEVVVYNEEDDGVKYGGEGDIECLFFRDGIGFVFWGEVFL